MITTIRVQVGENVNTYPAEIGAYAEFLSMGLPLYSLHSALKRSREMLAGKGSEWTSSLWVSLDESGLAYRIEVTKRGSWKIQGASPRRDLDNVKALYVA